MKAMLQRGGGLFLLLNTDSRTLFIVSSLSINGKIRYVIFTLNISNAATDAGLLEFEDSRKRLELDRIREKSSSL